MLGFARSAASLTRNLKNVPSLLGEGFGILGAGALASAAVNTINNNRKNNTPTPGVV